MSEADLQKWETRYRQATADAAAPPEPFVMASVQGLPVGRAADVAGGRGRHALALARLGWRTTLVDIAPTALTLAQREAEAAGRSLTTAAVDLDDPTAYAGCLAPGAFDLVVCAWFLPSSALWARCVKTLKHGGHLVYVQPTQRNRDRHDRPSARFLLDDGWLGDHLEGLGFTVLRYEEGWDARDHHTARALARR